MLFAKVLKPPSRMWTPTTFGACSLLGPSRNGSKLGGPGSPPYYLNGSPEGREKLFLKIDSSLTFRVSMRTDENSPSPRSQVLFWPFEVDTEESLFFNKKKIEQKNRAVETKDDHLTSGEQTVPKRKQGWFILGKTHYKFQAMITCGS